MKLAVHCHSPQHSATLLRGLLLLWLIGSGLTATAQKKYTYYDSLVNEQMNGALFNPSATDSSRRHVHHAMATFHDKNKPLPGCMWYGNDFSLQRVRTKSLPLDSLPDEITIRLAQTEKDFCFPVKGSLNSPYGWRWGRAHRGVDIGLQTGDKVHATFAGVVRLACYMSGYGNVIVLRHANGLETVYGHLSKINVKPYQIVKAGDVIGLGGSTGRSTDPHLHFEVRFQYETVDPEWILDFKNYTLRTRRLKINKTYFGVTRPRGNQTLSYKADASYIKERTRRNGVYYVIQARDSWEDIAIRFSTTVEEIKKMNPDIKRPVEGCRIKVR